MHRLSVIGKPIAILACLGALAGCGGGSAAPPPAVTPPVVTPPAAITGVATTSNVAVVTAKNAN